MIKNATYLIFFLTLVLIFSCKPEYPIPTFDNGTKIKYYIYEKKIINDETPIPINDTTKFEYDKQNRLKKITLSINGSSYNSIFVLKYKEKYISQKRYWYDKTKNSQILIETLEYYLDNNGNIVKCLRFDESNRLFRNNTLEYNASNMLVAIHKDDEKIREFEYFDDYFQIKNDTMLMKYYYDKTKNNLNMYFYDKESFPSISGYCLLKNTMFKNTIKNIEDSSGTKIYVHYKYNNDSLINQISFEYIYPLSNDSLTHINKEELFYKIVY